MTQPFLHIFDVCPILDQDGGMGMSERVEIKLYVELVVDDTACIAGQIWVD